MRMPAHGWRVQGCMRGPAHCALPWRTSPCLRGLQAGRQGLGPAAHALSRRGACLDAGGSADAPSMTSAAQTAAALVSACAVPAAARCAWAAATAHATLEPSRSICRARAQDRIGSRSGGLPKPHIS